SLLPILPPPPPPTLFPYTTLFRSKVEVAEAAPPPSIVTNRTALPPLEIEVVAGDDRRTVKPGTNSVKVDMTVATPARKRPHWPADRKSTRLNSSHVKISYAVFCLK